MVIDGGRKGNVLSWMNVPVYILDSLILSALPALPPALVGVAKDALQLVNSNLDDDLMVVVDVNCSC